MKNINWIAIGVIFIILNGIVDVETRTRQKCIGKGFNKLGYCNGRQVTVEYKVIEIFDIWEYKI